MYTYILTSAFKERLHNILMQERHITSDDIVRVMLSVDNIIVTTKTDTIFISYVDFKHQED